MTIPYSYAIVAGIVEGTIEGAEDPDFGYGVAAAVPGVDDVEIIHPRRLCDSRRLCGRPGRAGEHAAMAARLEQARKDFLGSFPGLDESLDDSLVKSPG